MLIAKNTQSKKCQWGIFSAAFRPSRERRERHVTRFPARPARLKRVLGHTHRAIHLVAEFLMKWIDCGIHDECLLEALSRPGC